MMFGESACHAFAVHITKDLPAPREVAAMFEVARLAPDPIVFLLILWATTGLTFIHLGVLGYRALRSLGRRPPAAPEPPPLSTAPTLTFLIPVYNDKTTIGPAIESVLRQSVRPQRILVVDDGSTDGTGAIIDAYKDRGVDVLHLPKNVGKSRALDAALRSVDTDLVAITDADSLVHADYVKEVLQSFRDPDLAAVGGAVESIPHTWVTAARHIEYMLTVRIDRDAEDTMKALVVLPGVSTTYRTRILRELGYEFDTIAEDFDLTFRMQRAGHKIGMNLRAKVFTSDPPTLAAYYRQLVRWYTDFFLVLKKHRKVLGKRVFGTVEVPMLVLNATAASALFFIIPIYLAFRAPYELPAFFLTAFAFDLALVLIAWRAYRRGDVFWALLSRIPTRAIGRFAYLLALTRVMIGRPGLAWDKLERRGTGKFLEDAAVARDSRTPAATSGAASRDAPVSAETPTTFGVAPQRAAIALVLAGGFAAPLVSTNVALLVLAAGSVFLMLRELGLAYRTSAGRGARVAWLVAAQFAYLGVAALVFRLLPYDLPDAWRIVALAAAGQAVFAVLAWPWRPMITIRPPGILGHLGALATGAFVLVVGLSPLAFAGYAVSFILLCLGTGNMRLLPRRATGT